MRSGIWAIALALFIRTGSNVEPPIVIAMLIITFVVIVVDIFEWVDSKLK